MFTTTTDSNKGLEIAHKSNIVKILYVNRNEFESVLCGTKKTVIVDNSPNYKAFEEIKVIEVNEKTRSHTGNSILCKIENLMKHKELPVNYITISIIPLYQSLSLSRQR